MTLIRSLLCLIASLTASTAAAAYEVSPTGPVTIGETFFIRSAAMNEDRRINVYFPPGFSIHAAQALPVLYMPDGGMGEDFLHIAGLLQVLITNRSMRPFVLVGIENTRRQRDMTGPTQNESDQRNHPDAGGSQALRTFIRNELMPEIRKRYPITGESAIIGESLAGLFVVETFLLEPGLFDIYIAIDPSLWWNDRWLLQFSEASIDKDRRDGKTLVLATSGQPGMAELAQRLMGALSACRKRCARHEYIHLADENHATIYHPAALRSLPLAMPVRAATP